MVYEQLVVNLVNIKQHTSSDSHPRLHRSCLKERESHVQFFCINETNVTFNTSALFIVSFCCFYFSIGNDALGTSFVHECISRKKSFEIEGYKDLLVRMRHKEIENVR